MVPGWSSTKVVQMVLIGCISKSPGKKIGFQNAIVKNLLVWKCKALSFHILYIASSRGPLPKLFKLCPWGHNFTLNYIRKSSNDIFSWTANGNLTKLNRNGPWVISYQNGQMVLIGCICRSRGQKIGYQKAIFKNLFLWNYKVQSFHMRYITSSRGPQPKLFKLCPWG